MEIGLIIGLAAINMLTAFMFYRFGRADGYEKGFDEASDYARHGFVQGEEM